MIRFPMTLISVYQSIRTTIIVLVIIIATFRLYQLGFFRYLSYSVIYRKFENEPSHLTDVDGYYFASYNRRYIFYQDNSFFFLFIYLGDINSSTKQDFIYKPYQKRVKLPIRSDYNKENSLNSLNRLMYNNGSWK